MEPALSEPPPDPALPLEKAVLAVARCKAEEVAARHPHRLVVGADTIVVAGGENSGQAGSPEEAGRMLRLLAGRTHEVMTGVWICSPGLCGGFTDTASVSFFPMTEEEIAEYVDSGEPMDKAGAYAIQGTGMRYIQGIHGDFYTVMGLPAPACGASCENSGRRARKRPDFPKKGNFLLRKTPAQYIIISQAVKYNKWNKKGTGIICYLRRTKGEEEQLCYSTAILGSIWGPPTRWYICGARGLSCGSRPWWRWT